MLTSINLNDKPPRSTCNDENIAPHSENNIKKLIAFIAEDQSRAHHWYKHKQGATFAQISQKVRSMCHSFSDALLWFKSVPHNYQAVWFHWLVRHYPVNILTSLTTSSATLDDMIRCFSELSDTQINQLLTTPAVTYSNAIIALILLGFKYERFIKIQKNQRNNIEQALVFHMAQLLRYEEMIDATWLLHMAIYHSPQTEAHFMALNSEEKQDLIASFELLPISDLLNAAPAETITNCLDLLLYFVKPERLSSALTKLQATQYAQVISKICCNVAATESYWTLYRLHRNFSKKLLLNAARGAFPLLTTKDYITLASIIHQKFLLSQYDHHAVLRLFPNPKSIIAGLKHSTLKNLLLPSLLIDNGRNLALFGVNQNIINMILNLPNNTAKIKTIINALKGEQKSCLTASMQSPFLTKRVEALEQKSEEALIPKDSIEMRTSVDAENDTKLLAFFDEFLLEQLEEDAAKHETVPLSREKSSLISSDPTWAFDEVFDCVIPVLFESPSRTQFAQNGGAPNAIIQSSETASITDYEEILALLNHTPEKKPAESMQKNASNFSAEHDVIINSPALDFDDLFLSLLSTPDKPNSKHLQEQTSGKKRAFSEIR